MVTRMHLVLAIVRTYVHTLFYTLKCCVRPFVCHVNSSYVIIVIIYLPVHEALIELFKCFKTGCGYKTWPILKMMHYSPKM